MSFQPTPLWNPVEVTPPWGWNPAATFLTAYTTMQENQREQQEFQMASELQRILLPAKAAEAEFNIKKFAYESENLANAYKLQSDMIDERRRLLRSGGSSGSSSTVQGSATNTSQNKTDDPLSFNISTAATQKQPSVASNSSYVLGDGVQPVIGR